MIDKPCILLVDDNEANRLMYQEILRGHSYHVVTACDGAAAKDFYTMVHPDISLVLLDVDMPILDGSSCLRSMRSINPDLSCVAITAHIDHPKLDDMISQGISGILRKPFGRSELLKWVEKILPRPLVRNRNETDWPWDEE